MFSPFFLFCFMEGGGAWWDICLRCSDCIVTDSGVFVQIYSVNKLWTDIWLFSFPYFEMIKNSAPTTCSITPGRKHDPFFWSPIRSNNKRKYTLDEIVCYVACSILRGSIYWIISGISDEIIHWDLLSKDLSADFDKRARGLFISTLQLADSSSVMWRFCSPFHPPI